MEHSETNEKYGKQVGKIHDSIRNLPSGKLT